MAHVHARLVLCDIVSGNIVTGYLGIPPYGFPEPLRTKIVRNLPRIEGRPGKSMPACDLDKVKAELEAKWGSGTISENDVASAVMYPKVGWGVVERPAVLVLLLITIALRCLRIIARCLKNTETCPSFPRATFFRH